MDENQNQNHENRDYVAEAKALVAIYRDIRRHPNSWQARDLDLGIEPRHLEALWELIELRDEAIRTLLD